MAVTRQQRGADAAATRRPPPVVRCRINSRLGMARETGLAARLSIGATADRAGPRYEGRRFSRGDGGGGGGTEAEEKTEAGERLSVVCHTMSRSAVWEPKDQTSRK